MHLPRTLLNSDSELGIFRYVVSIPPPTLYHYTSMQGLLGIVESQKLWAADTRYLNDATESVYVFDLLKTHILRRLTQTTGSAQTPYLELLQAMEKRKVWDVFVASFSEDGDSLSQWRAYSRGGIGFSVGFASSSLRADHVSDPFGGTPHSVNSQLGKVVYLDDDSDSALEDLLDSSMKGAQAFSSFARDIALPELATGFISVVAPMFKHYSFKEEREWRLTLSKIPITMPGKRFRVGRSTLVPYVEAEPHMKQGYFIKEVVVGPTPQPELSIEAIKSLFESQKHPEIIVRPSRVPYRHW